MVAKAFGKRPDNVIRDIEKTIKGMPEEFDTKLNFEVCYKTMSCRTVSRRNSIDSQRWIDASGYVLHQKRSDAYQDRLHQRLQLDVRDASRLGGQFEEEQ